MRHRGYLLIWELPLVLLFLALQSEGSAGDCAVGYAHTNGVCTDENECAMDDDYEDYEPICGENAQCFNTKGSYYCQCQSGFRSSRGNVNFTGADGDKCKDINECKEEKIDCGPHAECQNIEGSYTCVCNYGFTISSGKETFKDGQGLTCQDKCTVENINCGPHATCKKNDGSYVCVCEDGFEKSSREKTFSDGKGCQDIDECTVENINCGPHATCKNNDGSYVCLCEDGFATSSREKTFSDGKGVTCQGLSASCKVPGNVLYEKSE